MSLDILLHTSAHLSMTPTQDNTSAMWIVLILHRLGTDDQKMYVFRTDAIPPPPRCLPPTVCGGAHNTADCHNSTHLPALLGKIKVKYENRAGRPVLALSLCSLCESRGCLGQVFFFFWLFFCLVHCNTLGMYNTIGHSVGAQ